MRAVPVDVVPAGAVHARAAAALVHLGVAVGRLEALGTLAVEAVLFIHTRASVPAGAGRTLVDLHVALGAWQREKIIVRYGKWMDGLFFFWSYLAAGLTGEAGFADTVVAVDAVFADAVVTRVAGAVVEVYLAVGAWVKTAVLLFKRDFLQFNRNRKKKMCTLLCFFVFFFIFKTFYTAVRY